MSETAMIPSGTWNKCYKCKSDMWIPQSLQEAAFRARGEIAFFCSYGHRQFYCEGESSEETLRRERDRLAQQIAQRDDEIKDLTMRCQASELRTIKEAAKAKRLEKRASAGVCPCCNRTFIALQRHIGSKHPEFQKSAKIIPPWSARLRLSGVLGGGPV